MLSMDVAKLLASRAEQRVMPIPECGCWIWMGAVSKLGYAQIGLGKKRHYVHRVMYAAHKGPIPDDLPLDHLCRVPACCNPDHLEPVSGRVNTLRGVSFSAENAKKTHCPKGHPLEGDNLCRYAWVHRGWRQCRECANEAWRTKSKARKAAS